MRTEHLYIWRILWTGKWRNTRYHCTEEHIHFEHPEAVRLEYTLIVHEVQRPNRKGRPWDASEIRAGAAMSRATPTAQ